jgi:DUF4097 and DUF4098 domain-containing protein YvlB
MSWLYTIFVAGLLFSNGGDIDLPLLNSGATNKAVLAAGDLVEKSSHIYPLSSGGRVSVSNPNGPIILESWDRNEVQVDITKIGDSQESLDSIDIDVVAKRSHLEIEASIKGGRTAAADEDYRHRRIEVQFRLKVPRNAILNEIKTVNGNVTASDFTNVTQISVVNGTVTARNLQGTARLSTVNGELKTIFDDLSSVAAVELETVNGRIKLELPSDANATLRADSMSGEIANDFGLPVRKGKHVGRDLHGRLGDGGVPLHLTSVNGNLYILRKKDGKAQSAVTNLLNSKTDEDEDVEVSNAVGPRKAESVARSVNRSVRTSERSEKGSQKDLEKAEALIEKLKKEDLPDVKIKLDEKEFKNAIAEGFKQPGFPAGFGEAMWSSTPVMVEQRTASFEVKGTPRISVDASMCAVRVRGWDQPTVKYVLTEERFAKDNALKVTQNATDSAVSLRVGNSSRASAGVWQYENRFRIEVYVPKKADVTVTTERDVRVENVSGKIDIAGESGGVSVRDSEGNLKIRSNDGLIRIIGFRGDLDMTTSDSDVYLEGEFTKIAADAGDAKVTLTMPSTQNASISTNTAIQSEGLNIARDGDRRWRLGSGGPKYDFEFAEGQLIVRNQSRIDAN